MRLSLPSFRKNQNKGARTALSEKSAKTNTCEVSQDKAFPPFCSKFLLCVLLSISLVLCLQGAPFVAWGDESQDSQETSQTEGNENQDNSQASSQDQSETEDPNNKVYVNQLSDSSFLYETAIADLAEADSYYEGLTVLVKGEVVGDRVNDEFREDTCWITLQDDEENPSVVAVFMTKDQSSIIDTYGQYGKVGTQLQVRGTYHLECSEHQGMSDIHAEEVSALQEGYEQNPAPNMRTFGLAIVACVIGVALMAAYYIKRERML